MIQLLVGKAKTRPPSLKRYKNIIGITIDSKEGSLGILSSKLPITYQISVSSSNKKIISGEDSKAFCGRETLTRGSGVEQLILWYLKGGSSVPKGFQRSLHLIDFFMIFYYLGMVFIRLLVDLEDLTQ